MRRASWMSSMTALYPEKFVFDVFGLPKILARDLAKNLEEQAFQFKPDIHLGELATNLRYVETDHAKLIEVTTASGTYLSRALIITSGNGIITPRKLPNERADEFEGKGIIYAVQRDELHGHERLEAVTVRDWRQNLHKLEIDALLPMIGFKINLGPLAKWGLELEDKHIKVDARIRTNLAGVFAAGDVATFDDKIKLIATGFAEAAMAVKSALEYMHPEQKVKVAFSSVSGVPAVKT